MEFKRSWNEKGFQKVISEDRCRIWACDSPHLLFQERKHTLWFTDSCRHTLKGPERSITVDVFVAVYKKKRGWLNIYRQDPPVHQRGRAQACSTWTVTDPHSPLQLLGRTLHHGACVTSSLPPARVLCFHLPACTYLVFILSNSNKRTGRRELYLFTMWWHHL